MKLFKHVVRSMDQNVYFYYDENTMEAVIVDPGDDGEKIMAMVEEKGLNVKAILLTHGHWDHTGAIPTIRKKYNWPVAAHDWETQLLNDKDGKLGSMVAGADFVPEMVLEDGDLIGLGEENIRVIHTPGHTMGGVCFYCEKGQILFSGDSLFYASIGRTDFPNPPVIDGKGYPTSENFTKLIESIKKLYVLNDDVVVYPGHGSETRIGFEKKYNPFVKG